LTMYSKSLVDDATELLAACRTNGLRIATAESCTGGLISGLLTAVPGSSDVVDRGFVTYTNEAKHEMLGVPDDLFATQGAVSTEVARAMAAGVLERSDADLAVGVTGVAGPGGGTATKPVGLVHLSACRKGGATIDERCVFSGDRSDVRIQAVAVALEMLRALAE